MASSVKPHMKALARKNRKDLTQPEIKLWYELKEFKQIGAHFRKQALMGNYIVDFVCHGKKLVIELDGDSHGEALPKANDDERDAWLKAQGYTVMRVWNHELYENLDGVLDEIHRHLISFPPNSSPSRGGEYGLNPPSPPWGGTEGRGSLHNNAAKRSSQ